MSKYFCFLLTSLLVATIMIFPGCVSKKESQREEPASNSKQNSKLPEEFTETKEELDAIAQWKERPFEEIVAAAFAGNPAAAYTVGITYLFGLGGPVDTNMANDFFSMGATVGFGPTLHKIQFMYLEDTPNIFLAMVYLNLTIASGHKEEFLKYEKVKNSFRESLKNEKSNRIISEIERIATHKYAAIKKNQKLASSHNNNAKFIFETENITDEDLLFDTDYWGKVAEGNAPKDLQKWLNENYSLKIKRVAEKSKTRKERLACYKEAI